MSAKAYRQTWTVYQQMLLDEVNKYTAETEWADKPLKDIHVATSRQPENAPLYNVAAMAHFNHMFFESLSPQKTEIRDRLLDDIEQSFGSVEELQEDMLNHAMAMFGNGFVWLIRYPLNSVSNMQSGYRILCTYNAGSPYSDAYRMRQDADRSTDPMRYVADNQRYATGRTQYMAGAGRSGFDGANQLKGTPILCLNNFHHMWLFDYGITGKSTYLQAWWQRINWDKVASRNLVGK